MTKIVKGKKRKAPRRKHVGYVESPLDRKVEDGVAERMLGSLGGIKWLIYRDGVVDWEQSGYA
ncbi:MAG: hypothetical protein WCS89_00685 [Candidatus Paceibacterota bacterium]|jgi:hypothetical protein